MRMFMRGLHDLWCAVTNACRIEPPSDDPDVQFLVRSQKAAHQAADEERRRREHYIARDLLRRVDGRVSHDA